MSFHHHEVVGAKMTRKRMRALKYSKQMVDDVSQLVYLHLRFHGYGDGKWTDSAVRRYVTDAGPLLPRLHKLVRADCTTRNKRRAARLQANYDDLEARIAELAAKEDLQRVRPDLDGNEIMRILDIPAGPQVGEAWRYLKELRLDRGPLEPRRGGGRTAEVVERQELTRRRIGVDYCLSDGDGSATMWTAPLDTDVDGNGTLDAVGLDVDGDGSVDDALADLDGDGIADHAVLDGQSYFTDDGSGTWAVSVDRGGHVAVVRPRRRRAGGRSRGRPGRRRPGRRSAARRRRQRPGRPCAVGDGVAHVDTDGDGRWDIRLTDSNGDGRADVVNDL